MNVTYCCGYCHQYLSPAAMQAAHQKGEHSCGNPADSFYRVYRVHCAWCGVPIGRAEVEGSHGICRDCTRVHFEMETAT